MVLLHLGTGFVPLNNVYDGNLTQFTGKEVIRYRGKEVYCAHYHGGMVNIVRE
jgi:hypothetical protein